MSSNDRRLLRHLLVVVTIKVAALAALWWVFVQDNQVPVDAQRAADHFGVASPGQGGHL